MSGVELLWRMAGWQFCCVRETESPRRGCAVPRLLLTINTKPGAAAAAAAIAASEICVDNGGAINALALWYYSRMPNVKNVQ